MVKKLKVGLYSDPNILSVNILESLLLHGAEVIVFTNQQHLWRENTKHLVNLGVFNFFGQNMNRDVSMYDCVIFCGGFLVKENAYSDFNSFFSQKVFGNTKTLALFPFEINLYKNINKFKISKNAGIVYIGDLLGPGIDIFSNLDIVKKINNALEKGKLTMGIGEIFFPILASSAAKTITKWAFLNESYGKTTFLIGPKVSSFDFWNSHLKIIPKLKVEYDTNLPSRYIPKGYPTKRINSDFSNLLNLTYGSLLKRRSNSNTVLEPITKKLKKVNKPNGRFRKIRSALFYLFIVLMFPVITIIVSSAFGYIAYRALLTENIQLAQRAVLVASSILEIGKKESDFISVIPILGKPFKETSYIAYVGISTFDMFNNLAPLLNVGKKFVGNVLGNGIYNVGETSAELKNGMDYLYQQVSLLQVETDDKEKDGVIAATQIKSLVNFNKIKNVSQQGAILLNNLPEILGSKSNKNYLILFQNNMELRPTGGFIGSYGIATFGGGKLNALSVNDIYSADGQLRGHIEPPAPIKDYLNEANWWFRDSNWDPDFPTSATRAEWFLEKEMGQQVDGVIAIDLLPIKNILAHTGPIFLPDYNLTITADNLYEKTQEEVHKDFFPGSRKKASFLTILSRVLLTKLGELDSKQNLGVLMSVYKGFEARNIQANLHAPVVQSAIERLEWGGGFPTYTCGDNCYSDSISDIEANLGVNKSNYFITRSFDMDINISKGVLKRELNIIINNSANTSLGPSGYYKNYFRILVPLDSELKELKSISGQSVVNIEPDIVDLKNRKEIGGYIEIGPQQTKTINVVWETKISENINSYGMFFRKQGGTLEDPLIIKLRTPGQIKMSNPVFSLTKEGSSTYNTTLSKDFFARINW